jgi:hypothetical protein
MSNLTTYDYLKDNRWRREWAPAGLISNGEGTMAAYGARWVSMDSGRRGEILPDRQGFAYDDTASRDALMGALEHIQLHRPTPFWYNDEPADVTDRAMMEVQHGQDEWGAMWASGISRAWNLEFHMECRGGYIHVEAWLLS